MKTSVKFVANTPARDAMRAAGVDSPGGEMPLACPFNIGDTFSFPASKQVVFEVMHRHLQMRPDGTARWLIGIRPSLNPLLDESTYERPQD